MTIDEAIDHCLAVASSADTCEECRKDHMQLVGWLIELRDRRKYDWVDFITNPDRVPDDSDYVETIMLSRDATGNPVEDKVWNRHYGHESGQFFDSNSRWKVIAWRHIRPFKEQGL